ncbi:hypothetical protein KHA87_20320 [Bacillus sp. FJAT-49736]|nr:hypothetical protein [Bacillus sp. FJAT-49736]
MPKIKVEAEIKRKMAEKWIWIAEKSGENAEKNREYAENQDGSRNKKGNGRKMDKNCRKKWENAEKSRVYAENQGGSRNI